MNILQRVNYWFLYLSHIIYIYKFSVFFLIKIILLDCLVLTYILVMKFRHLIFFTKMYESDFGNLNYFFIFLEYIIKYFFFSKFLKNGSTAFSWKEMKLFSAKCKIYIGFFEDTTFFYYSNDFRKISNEFIRLNLVNCYVIKNRNSPKLSKGLWYLVYSYFQKKVIPQFNM